MHTPHITPPPPPPPPARGGILTVLALLLATAGAAQAATPQGLAASPAPPAHDSYPAVRGVPDCPPDEGGIPLCMAVRTGSGVLTPDPRPADAAPVTQTLPYTGHSPAASLPPIQHSADPGDATPGTPGPGDDTPEIPGPGDAVAGSSPCGEPRYRPSLLHHVKWFYRSWIVNDLDGVRIRGMRSSRHQTGIAVYSPPDRDLVVSLEYRDGHGRAWDGTAAWRHGVRHDIKKGTISGWYPYDDPEEDETRFYAWDTNYYARHQLWTVRDPDSEGVACIYLHTAGRSRRNCLGGLPSLPGVYPRGLPQHQRCVYKR